MNPADDPDAAPQLDGNAQGVLEHVDAAGQIEHPPELPGAVEALRSRPPSDSSSVLSLPGSRLRGDFECWEDWQILAFCGLVACAVVGCLVLYWEWYPVL
jgi:hypothetical protein